MLRRGTTLETPTSVDGARRRGRRFVRRSLAFVVLAVALLVGAATSTSAGVGDVGYEGLSFSGTSTPTGQKRAESILWWNDGSWWASMWDTVSSDFEIFKLDTSTQQWSSTGVTLDARPNTHADVLWDGTKLYVASHKRPSADETLPVSGFPSYLYRFSYDGTSGTYIRDSGYPVPINDYNTETLVIEKDSTGTLWATWMQDSKIYVNRTIGGDDRVWDAPFALPVDNATVTADDNSSLVAFGGNKIGAMWSNQAANAMYFAIHRDGEPATSWESSRAVLQGPRMADDHINLKSDAGGRVYAAIKTNQTISTSPLTMLLVRDRTTGDWQSHVLDRVSECPNRPTVLIDEEKSMLHVFTTGPAAPDYACNTTGGSIYEKTSPLNEISFESGYGKTVMHDADSAAVHNAASTKQNVSSRGGLVVLASNGKTARYWYHYDPLTAGLPSAPVANFTGTPTSGVAPLTVAFTDQSSALPTGWAWDFGDGGTSTGQHPSYTYTQPGTYTVTLTASNSAGSDTKTITGYVSVIAPPPDFSLSAAPSKRTVLRGQSADYQVAVTPTNGFAGSVSFSISQVPSGMTVSFDPNPLSVSSASSTKLTVRTTSSAKIGTHTLTILGTSGPLTRSTTVSLQIKNK